MAEILIRGMEMPKNCMVCDFRNRGFDLNGDLFCNCRLTKENVPDYYNIRMENCPLRELPEHGDLVDLDERVTKQIYDDYNMELYMKTKTVRQWLNVDEKESIHIVIPSNKEVER